MRRILSSIVTVFITLLCVIIMLVCPAYELVRSIKFLIAHRDQVGRGEWGFRLWYTFAGMMEGMTKGMTKGVHDALREELEKCAEFFIKDEA